MKQVYVWEVYTLVFYLKFNLITLLVIVLREIAAKLA